MPRKYEAPISEAEEYVMTFYKHHVHSFPAVTKEMTPATIYSAANALADRYRHAMDYGRLMDPVGAEKVWSWLVLVMTNFANESRRENDRKAQSK
jgi:hypothetical protein